MGAEQRRAGREPSSYILYAAARTCMVRAVLYCTVLRAFSHFHALYRCFPYSCTPCKPHSQLKIGPTPTPPTPSVYVCTATAVCMRESENRYPLARPPRSASARAPAAPRYGTAAVACLLLAAQPNYCWWWRLSPSPPSGPSWHSAPIWLPCELSCVSLGGL